jgi:hypothetical protein
MNAALHLVWLFSPISPPYLRRCILLERASTPSASGCGLMLDKWPTWNSTLNVLTNAVLLLLPCIPQCLLSIAATPSAFGGGSTFGAASSGGGLFGGASTPAFGAPSAASPFGGTSTPAFGTPGDTLSFMSVLWLLVFLCCVCCLAVSCCCWFCRLLPAPVGHKHPYLWHTR